MVNINIICQSDLSALSALVEQMQGQMGGGIKQIQSGSYYSAIHYKWDTTNNYAFHVYVPDIDISPVDDVNKCLLIIQNSYFQYINNNKFDYSDVILLTRGYCGAAYLTNRLKWRIYERKLTLDHMIAETTNNSYTNSTDLSAIGAECYITNGYLSQSRDYSFLYISADLNYGSSYSFGLGLLDTSSPDNDHTHSKIFYSFDYTLIEFS